MRTRVVHARKDNLTSSETSKKSPNFYKSCPKIISQETLKTLTKIPKNPQKCGQFGQTFEQPFKSLTSHLAHLECSEGGGMGEGKFSP